MSDEEQQEEELAVLASILNVESVVTSMESRPLTGSFPVEVDLVTPFHVFSNKTGAETDVEYLPPIQLDFTLPPNYPSVNPPSFHLSCVWLTEDQLLRVSEELERLWRESSNGVVLFTWMNFLRTDLVGFLNIRSPLVLDGDQLRIVIGHDIARREQFFASSVFTCQVCFCERSGRLCLRFHACGHVFCKACLKDYFEVVIEEGSVNMLRCLAEECESDVHPIQVKELVSKELYDRYDRLLLQTTLDTMRDVVYCPGKACCAPVLVDEELSMGSCPQCQYVFCVHCQMTYHGIQKCRNKAEEMKQRLKERCQEDDDERMVEQFGLQMEKEFEKLNREIADNNMSMEWKDENCKQCPKCYTYIQKNDGCNKMTCFKCGCKFCWLCLKSLLSGNPYEHFTDASSICYGKQNFRPEELVV